MPKIFDLQNSALLLVPQKHYLEVWKLQQQQQKYMQGDKIICRVRIFSLSILSEIKSRFSNAKHFVGFNSCW